MISIVALKAAGGSLDDAIEIVEAVTFIIKSLFAREILAAAATPRRRSAWSLRPASPCAAEPSGASTGLDEACEVREGGRAAPSARVSSDRRGRQHRARFGARRRRSLGAEGPRRL